MDLRAFAHSVMHLKLSNKHTHSGAEEGVCVCVAGREWKCCLALERDSCANMQLMMSHRRGLWVRPGQTHFDGSFYGDPESRCGIGDLRWGCGGKYTDDVWVYKWKQTISVNLQETRPRLCPRDTSITIPHISDIRRVMLHIFMHSFLNTATC